MGAGAANTSYGANSMLVQIGDKLQGLPPTTNKRAELIPHIRRRADGDKRDWIFCINQLAGGVGRHAGQFAHGADGVDKNNCQEGPYESVPSSLFNCDTWYQLAELQTWVDTHLSSMFATMSQSSISQNDPTFYGYLGLTLIPTFLLNGSVDSGASVSTGSTPPTITTTINNYALAIDALVDNSLWLDHNISTVPNFDISQFGSSVPSSTTLDLLSNTGLTNAGNLLAEITTNLNDPANANVLNTLNDLFGKKFKIDGYPGNLSYAVYIFPETFVGGSVMSNIVTWLSNAQTANDRGNAQWDNYYTSNGGSHNGLTQAIAIKHDTANPTLEMCKLTNVCDQDQVQLVGASVTAPGTVSTAGSYPLASDITQDYLVQE